MSIDRMWPQEKTGVLCRCDLFVKAKLLRDNKTILICDNGHQEFDHIEPKKKGLK